MLELLATVEVRLERLHQPAQWGNIGSENTVRPMGNADSILIPQDFLHYIIQCETSAMCSFTTSNASFSHGEKLVCCLHGLVRQCGENGKLRVGWVFLTTLLKFRAIPPSPPLRIFDPTSHKSQRLVHAALDIDMSMVTFTQLDFR